MKKDTSDALQAARTAGSSAFLEAYTRYLAGQTVEKQRRTEDDLAVLVRRRVEHGLEVYRLRTLLRECEQIIMTQIGENAARELLAGIRQELKGQSI